MSQLKLYIAIILFIIAPTLAVIILLTWDNDYSLLGAIATCVAVALIAMSILDDYLKDHAYYNYSIGYDEGAKDQYI